MNSYLKNLLHSDCFGNLGIVEIVLRFLFVSRGNFFYCLLAF